MWSAIACSSCHLCCWVEIIFLTPSLLLPNPARELVGLEARLQPLGGADLLEFMSLQLWRNKATPDSKSRGGARSCLWYLSRRGLHVKIVCLSSQDKIGQVCFSLELLRRGSRGVQREWAGPADKVKVKEGTVLLRQMVCSSPSLCLPPLYRLKVSELGTCGSHL